MKPPPDQSANWQKTAGFLFGFSLIPEKSVHRQQITTVIIMNILQRLFPEEAQSSARLEDLSWYFFFPQHNCKSADCNKNKIMFSSLLIHMGGLSLWACERVVLSRNRNTTVKMGFPNLVFADGPHGIDCVSDTKQNKVKIFSNCDQTVESRACLQIECR